MAIDEAGGEGLVLALDSGTTSVRAVLFDHGGRAVAQASQPISQSYPRPGWVELDAREILAKQVSVIAQVQYAGGPRTPRIEAVGIANQRETAVVWDRRTGEPVCGAICWQCRRTEPMMEELARRGLGEAVAERTGLVLDPYFTASKVAWILDNVPGARRRAENGELLMGTVDSWLVWNLTGGEAHATDRTNASRTMLYDIHGQRWDSWLLDLFGIPESMLPEVKPSICRYGRVASDILSSRPPIYGVAGDQQASLFGQRCFEAGEVKATYGTGCFVLMNTGAKAAASKSGLLTTVTATAGDRAGYALEGSVFNAGSAVQWLCDGLGLADSAQDTERIARSVSDTGGVYMVPALTGLGAPWWDPSARGLLCGLTRGTTRSQVVRAVLEGVAYRVYDVAEAMCRDAGTGIGHLVADGGVSRNAFVMQRQADLLGCRVLRSSCQESTALGAAYLAGLGCGYWSGLDELRSHASYDALYEPQEPPESRQADLDGWHAALDMCRTR